MTPVCVVDTNVLVVANGDSDQANSECELRCIEELERIKLNGRLALDTTGEILAEYAKRCCRSGSPGVGDEFFKWATDTAYVNGFLTDITPDPTKGYAEFPDDSNLSTFDQDDRKFVAVSCAHSDESEILNAVDSDYENHQPALADSGVVVRELCSDCLAQKIPETPKSA